MIHNDREYEVTQIKLRDLEKELAILANPDPNLQPYQILGRKNSLNILISELRQEILDYDHLKSAMIKDFPIHSIQELPTIIIKARIARGMTQKDLAEKIGIREEQLQRHEDHEYYGVEFNLLQEIMSVLNITFSSALIQLKEPLAPSELTTNNSFSEAGAGNNILTTTL